MNDSIGVAVCECIGQITHHQPRILFGIPVKLYDLIEKFSSGTKLHHHKIVVRAFEKID